jgi:putative flippase GtrA
MAKNYLLVGLFNTFSGAAVIFVARSFCSEFAANLLAYLFVVPLSFLAHREYSFRDRGGMLGAFGRYLPTVLAGYGGNYAVLALALDASISPYFAQAGAVTAHAGITCLLSRTFVFLAPSR